MTKSNHRVTVIIPIYGDWPSLQECIASVKKYVDTSRHKVLLVNDCGPEADLIEEKIKKEIKGTKGFHYFRNEENLGFLKNCNNAVFHLDKTANDILLLNSDTEATEGFVEELLEVLYTSEDHGAVSSRSNHATLASIPVRIDDDKQYTAKYSKKVYDSVKDILPKQSDIPVAHGFCMLIKRSLIKKYGLFDEVYGKGYCEEADFCMRLRLHGYKSLLSNRSYVYHARSKSFGEAERKMFIKQNEKVLYQRYPDLPELYRQYVTKYIDAVDWFSECFVEKTKKKVLLDVSHLQEHHTALVSHAMNSLNAASKRNAKGNIEYVIAAHRDVYEKYELDKFHLRTVFYGETNETFDVGVVFGGVVFPNNLALLNRHCAKIAIAELQPLEYFIALPEQARQTVQRDIYQKSIRLAKIIEGSALLNNLEMYAKASVGVAELRSRWQEVVSCGGHIYEKENDVAVEVKKASIMDTLKRFLIDR